eukprot:m.139911 g.139911  ORF g.139911 m.139911 type:complete len:413 (+) comp17071_c0_seq7:147-1385(+)
MLQLVPCCGSLNYPIQLEVLTPALLRVGSPHHYRKPIRRQVMPGYGKLVATAFVVQGQTNHGRGCGKNARGETNTNSFGRCPRWTNGHRSDFATRAIVFVRRRKRANKGVRSSSRHVIRLDALPVFPFDVGFVAGASVAADRICAGKAWLAREISTFVVVDATKAGCVLWLGHKPVGARVAPFGPRSPAALARRVAGTALHRARQVVTVLVWSTLVRQLWVQALVNVPTSLTLTLWDRRVPLGACFAEVQTKPSASTVASLVTRVTPKRPFGVDAIRRLCITVGYVGVGALVHIDTVFSLAGACVPCFACVASCWTGSGTCRFTCIVARLALLVHIIVIKSLAARAAVWSLVAILARARSFAGAVRVTITFTTAVAHLGPNASLCCRASSALGTVLSVCTAEFGLVDAQPLL